MKNKKALKLAASLGLVAAIGVGATLAYLSDVSNTLNNSFTVGEGFNPDGPGGNAVWIDEKAVNEKSTEPDDYYIDGDEERTLVGNTYNDLVAESTFTKDPVLRINAESVKSYGFIKVTGLDALEEMGITVDINYESWEKVDESNPANVIESDTEEGSIYEHTIVDGVYRYTGGEKNGLLDPTTSIASTSKFFTTITVSDNFNENGQYSAEGFEMPEIKLVGCAVQGVVVENNVERQLSISEIDLPHFA